MPVREPLEFVFFDVGATLVEPARDPAEAARDALRASPAGRAASPAALTEALVAMHAVYQADLDLCRSLEEEAGFWRRVAAAGLRSLHGAEPPRAEVESVAAALGAYDGVYRVRDGMRGVQSLM